MPRTVPRSHPSSPIASRRLPCSPPFGEIRARRIAYIGRVRRIRQVALPKLKALKSCSTGSLHRRGHELVEPFSRNV